MTKANLVIRSIRGRTTPAAGVAVYDLMCVHHGRLAVHDTMLICTMEERLYACPADVNILAELRYQILMSISTIVYPHESICDK